MNKDWLKRIVDTKGTRCPFEKRLCPGTREGKHGCGMWIVENIANNEGSQDIQAGCLLAFQYVVTNATHMEAIRTQAGMDKIANNITHAAAVVLSTRSFPPRLIEENGD